MCPQAENDAGKLAPANHTQITIRRNITIIGVFENAAATYDDWYGKPMGVYAFRSELNGIVALLPPSGVGVDIGAGTGIFAKRLSSEERTVICLDPSPKMLEKAVEKNLIAVLATAEDIPLRYGSMDFAYMVAVMEFLPDPLEALRSIGSVIRLDAPLVIVFINRESPWGELYSKLAEGKDPIFSRARLYTLVEIRHALKETGYEPMEIVGTLTASPNEPSDEINLSTVTSGAGIILVKARKRVFNSVEQFGG